MIDNRGEESLCSAADMGYELGVGYRCRVTDSRSERLGRDCG